jgi:hypothetical protein
MMGYFRSCGSGALALLISAILAIRALRRGLCPLTPYSLGRLNNNPGFAARYDLALLFRSLRCDVGGSRDRDLALFNGGNKFWHSRSLDDLGTLDRSMTDIQELGASLN